MEANKIVFIDKQGKQQYISVSDFCEVNLRVQDGQVVNVRYVKSERMKKLEKTLV